MTGQRHEALLYESDEHFLSVLVPFVRDGIEAGQPTVMAYGPRTAALLRGALPAGTPVRYLDGGALYTRPAGVIRAYRDMLAGQVAAGATGIRLAGELGPPMFGIQWDWWARYEAAVNHAYAEFPVWTMCCYDARLAPQRVVEDVRRCHPHLHGAGTTREFTEPDVFLREPRGAPEDPLRLDPPVLDLTDPSPAGARHAVRDAGARRLGETDLENLVLSVSEAVTNASKYGVPPVRMRCWAGDGRMLVAVSDLGTGPKDPFVGLLPVTGGEPGGLGLWITFQSCGNVVLDRAGEGFTLWMSAGSGDDAE